VWYSKAGLNAEPKPNKKNQMNSDDFTPACNDNGKDEMPPEWCAVRGTEGLNCNSNENDGILAILKEMGF
jgi:hypothetical protein